MSEKASLLDFEVEVLEVTVEAFAAEFEEGLGAFFKRVGALTAG